jgi:TetR/AcrR family transcriptional repressor of nem operon
MEETRKRILNAATELFLENGYEASGMAEILHRANANSGSFYYFFRSKEDLLGAVLDRYQEILYPVLLDPIWKATPDPIERIFRLLSKYRELILASGCSYGCPIGRLALEIAPGQRTIHRKVAANFDAWKAAVEQCLVEARARRQLPRNLDCQRLACLVLSVMEGGVMQSRSYGAVRPFDLSVEELRHYFSTLARAASPRIPGKKKPRRSPWKRLAGRSRR